MRARFFVSVLGFCFTSILFITPADASRYGMMRMTDADERELSAWIQGLDLYEAPDAYSPAGGSLSLLNHFHYNPELRDQTPTGTCWIWASTAMMSMYFDRQFNGDPELQNGLSVQFLASNAWMVGSNLNSGGHVGKTKAFYDMIGYAIPSSNVGAAWDTTFAVGEVRPSLIESGTPWSPFGSSSFPISSIALSQVKTWDIDGAGQVDAINNLKSVLDSGRPVGLLYFLPTTADWDRFDDFWANQPVETIIDLDYAKGHAWDKGGCGHWVVLVGYNDEDPDPAKHYWIILNTHGTADGKRPDTTFRLAMHMDYSAQITDNPDLALPYMYFWVIMDTVFAERNSPAPAKGLRDVTLALGGNDRRYSDMGSVFVSGARFSDPPDSIDSGKLTVNFLEIPCDSQTGSWSESVWGFRFATKAGYMPAVRLTINTQNNTWSAWIRGDNLVRRVNSADGLVGKFEYKEDPLDEDFTLLSQRGAVFDQIKTTARSSLKGP